MAGRGGVPRGASPPRSPATSTRAAVNAPSTSVQAWTQYVAAWLDADIALPSLDRRHSFALGKSRDALKITLLDACRPCTVLDSRCSDLSFAKQVDRAAAQRKSSARVPAAASSAVPRPISAALAPAMQEDEAATLLVLLSTGHLLAIDSLHLGIEAVLGVFPEAADVRSRFKIGTSLVAVMQEHGYAVVACGAQLGLAIIDIGPPESGGSPLPKPVDLPKGCIAVSVAAYPSDDGLLLVGCTGGRLLLYSASVGFKRQVSALSLNLVQTLDITSASPLAARGSVIPSLFRRQTTAGGSDIAVADAFVLAGDGDRLGMLAAGGGSAGAGAIGVWDVSLDAVQGQAAKKNTSVCRLRAQAKAPTAVIRVMLLAKGRVGAMWPLLLALDVTGEISFWEVQDGKLTPLCNVRYDVAARNAWDPVAAMTFALTGSVYLLTSAGSQESLNIGWLDIAALIRSCGHARSAVTPPVADQTTTCLGPPLSAQTSAAAAGATVVPGGGEVFFISESRLRQYRASNGKSTDLKFQGVPDSWRAQSILGVFPTQMDAAATHLVLAVFAGPAFGVWLVSTAGEVERQLPGAFDAAMLGTSRADAKIVWLTYENSVMAHIAPAFGGSASGNHVKSVLAPGVDRVISGPACGGQLLLYWGSQLQGGPLHLSGGAPADAGVPPVGGPIVSNLPMFGPTELVSWRWDCSGEGPWCLAVAAVSTVWVFRFTSSGRTQAVPQVSLLAWVDLQGCLVGAGRALSLAWLRQPSISAEAMPGVVLIGTPWGVMYWSLAPGQTPSCLVLCEKPQLLAGVLLDRLLLVEVQCNLSVLAGVDRMKSSKSLGGPKARVRTRLVSLLEAAAVRGGGASSNALSAAVGAVRDSDWRVVPTRFPESLPNATLQSLWPVASCSDAPPQLSHAASNFYRTARSAGDEFRALAAIVSVLQSGAAAPRRRGGSAAEENRAILQVDDAIRNNRIDPARSELLCCASKLLLDCASMAGRKNNEVGGLALASRGLAKHDLLPFGTLFAGVLRGLSQSGSHQLVLPLASQMGKAELSWPWSWPLRMSAPLVASLLSQKEGLSLDSLNSHERSGSSEPPDFSALALTQQSFSEPPAVRRPAQVVQPGEQNVVQVHTATVMQWLGVRSTEMQVRVLQAMLQESGARNSFSKNDGSPEFRSPPCIVGNGVLLYWRCADGEGTNVRDSAGCHRFGKLSGTTEWRGPLVKDDPMEMIDEWGSKLAPNFAIAFGRSAQLTYMPADGAPGEEDRQMLSLVGGGGETGAGLRHLKKARDEARRGEDDSDEEGPTLGWTVEFWVRLSTDAHGEVVLFARPLEDSNGSAPLSFTYTVSPPGFSVKSSGKALLNGTVSLPDLEDNEWTHVALRQKKAAGIEVWANDQVVLGPASHKLPVVPPPAGLQFGDVGLQMTEVRVWGVYRNDMELREFQRQPLPTLLSDERKTLKVRMRAAVDATPGPELADSGLFGLTQLVAPSSRGTRRRAALAEAPTTDPSPLAETTEDWGKDDAWGDPWATAPTDFGGFGADFGAPAEFSWPEPSSTWPVDDEIPPRASSPTWPTDDEMPPVASEPHSADIAPSLSSRAEEVASTMAQVRRRLATNEKHHPKGTSDKTDCCATCGAIIMPRMKFCKRCGAKCPEVPLKTASEVPSLREFSGYVNSTLKSNARPSDREIQIASTVGFSVSDIILIGGLEQNVIAAFGGSSIILNSPLLHGHHARTKVVKIPPEDAFPQDASPPIIVPTLEQVLPRLNSSDPKATAVESKIFAGVHALERQSYQLSVLNFRAALLLFSRQFVRRNVAGGPLIISPPIRARTEASAAYIILGTLLRRCEEIRTRIVQSCAGNAAAGHSAYMHADPELLRRLCSCWACVLRVAKAPCHTVRYAVQAMAVFFTMAKSVGGWLAAEQVASVLLSRCREMLTDRELEQVEYVAQAASVGRVARGASSGSVCVCPRCRHPLEPLSPSCGYCYAEILVCFRDLSLCDGRRALFCDVCSSAFSPPKGSSIEWSAPQAKHLQTSGGHARHKCVICGVGELMPKSGTNYPATIAF